MLILHVCVSVCVRAKYQPDDYVGYILLYVCVLVNYCQLHKRTHK